MRLDKFLTEAGLGTRSEVKRLLKDGNVLVNLEVVKTPDFKVDEIKDEVFYKGERLLYEQFRYYMLNKPAGCVSATQDKLSETVIDLLKGEPVKDLFPVGRLDKDTEGFLLITNDGALAHRLLAPKKHVDKVYIAKVDKELSDSEMKNFKEGLDIGDEKQTLPADIECLEPFTYRVTIHEGRYHQVKRMFEVFGSTVLYLKRMSMGGLLLDESLRIGEYKKLSDEDIQKLLN